MTDEPTLLSRVLAATGPDPALDGAIDGLVGHEGEAWPARYTASLDAAVALFERVRPGWNVLIDTRGPHARVYNFVDQGTKRGAADYGALAATPALTIIGALLRSLGQ